VQQFNFAGMPQSQKHIVNLQAGWDYGLVFGAGYGRQLNTKFPTVVHAGFSLPSGEKIFDDFKVKMGGTVQLVKVHNFRGSVVVEGVFRRFESAPARILNFGSDMKAVIGYYKPKWYVAGEFGFDKAIATHFHHKDSFREYFPEAQDGWYVPTGGNFYYGIQGGLTLKRNDVFLRAGKTVSEDLDKSAMVPLYLTVGGSMRF
jgi:hypothetical protein